MTRASAERSSDEPAPAATVVLCVRNGVATLERQLAALDAQDFAQPWELVLVDNGSTDGTRELADRWAQRMPQLRIVTEPQAGTNRARNRGVRNARADRLLFCDADDEVSPGWVHALVDALDQFDVVGGALDPYRLNGPNSPHAGVIQRTELPDVFGWSYAVSANLATTKAVFDAIGLFDEAFRLGSEEVDFCLRAQYAGFSIGFASSALVHYRVRTTARAVMRQRFFYGRGHQLLVAKHARLERIQSRPMQRWKVVAVSAAHLVRLFPAVLNRRTRLQYLASVAYLAGRVVELSREACYGPLFSRLPWIPESRSASR